MRMRLTRASGRVVLGEDRAIRVAMSHQTWDGAPATRAQLPVDFSIDCHNFCLSITEAEDLHRQLADTLAEAGRLNTLW